MKRFAAHYLFLPDVGFIKQQVVEVTGEGNVQDIFPLTKEIESVEWMPGVIALLSVNEIENMINIGMAFKTTPMFKINYLNILNQSSQCFKKAINESKQNGRMLFPYLFYPFDFTSMQPVAGTQHRLLR